MNKLSMFFLVLILPAWALPAQADGIFGMGLFSKKAKGIPAQRVPELIVILKTGQEERHRSAAAGELGKYDGAAYPEIVPILVEILQSDPSSGVRMDAASSLGGIRPVTQAAGQALERAAGHDDNWRARWHAKSILVKYRLAGYSSSRSDPGPKAGPKTEEPPLSQEPLPATTPAPAQFPTGSKAAKTPIPAAKKDDGMPEYRPSMPRPLPQGPAFTTAVPQQPLRTVPQPLPMVDDGPSLTPPAPPMTNPPPQKTPF